jgi:threonine/homoserine/homoserine lactone efflux protein
VDTELLLAALVFIVPMCFTPGPNNILCAAHGSRFGVQDTLPMILGMGVGWSILGVLIGMATNTIERYEAFFNVLGVVGALYIAYIGVSVMRSSTVKAEDVEHQLGFRTGFMLQIVNGKAWVHFLVLMTTFGHLFGSGLFAKVLLVQPSLLGPCLAHTFVRCSPRRLPEKPSTKSSVLRSWAWRRTSFLLNH